MRGNKACKVNPHCSMCVEAIGNVAFYQITLETCLYIIIIIITTRHLVGKKDGELENPLSPLSLLHAGASLITSHGDLSKRHVGWKCYGQFHRGVTDGIAGQNLACCRPDTDRESGDTVRILQ